MQMYEACYVDKQVEIPQNVLIIVNSQIKFVRYFTHQTIFSTELLQYISVMLVKLITSTITHVAQTSCCSISHTHTLIHIRMHGTHSDNNLNQHYNLDKCNYQQFSMIQ